MDHAYRDESCRYPLLHFLASSGMYFAANFDIEIKYSIFSFFCIPQLESVIAKMTDSKL
jgi:hypothetical protein